jgi:hypothetical protein
MKKIRYGLVLGLLLHFAPAFADDDNSNAKGLQAQPSSLSETRPTVAELPDRIS